MSCGSVKTDFARFQNGFAAKGLTVKASVLSRGVLGAARLVVTAVYVVLRNCSAVGLRNRRTVVP